MSWNDGVLQKFIKDYAKIAQTLHNLLKKDTKYVWSDEHEKRFKKVD